MTGTNGKNQNPKKIILIDNLTEINEIVDFLDSETLVISFDYESHKNLEQENIDHKISENFCIDESIELLQKQSYKFLEWHNLETIRDNVSFYGINIPKLYDEQLIHSIVKIVKKFSELKSIFKQYPNVSYHASGDLFLLIREFGNQISKIPNEKSDEFYFDKLKIGTNFGKKNISLSISSSSYNNIKNFGEKFLHRTLNKNNLPSNGTTLIVELNTKLFKNLFLESKNHNKSTLFYGRRRPAAWDIESYRIIKNSKCQIVSSDLLSKNEFETYKTKILSFNESFLNSITQNSQLDSFFTIGEISLASIIIPKIKQLIASKIEKSIFEILLTEKVFKNYSLDSVIIISEIGMTEQIVIHFANSMNVPILHIQEGLHIDTPEALNNSKHQGVFLEKADRYVAWGKFSKSNQISIGHADPQKILEFGSPRFSNLSYSKENSTEEFVLLATMPPQIEEISGLDVRNLENYITGIKKICEIIESQGKKIIIKLHPTKDILSISDVISKNFPSVQVISKGDINPLIQKCSSLIVTGFSTVIIQAQILQKPVISIPLIDYRWGEPSVFSEKSCLLAELDELDSILKKLDNDKLFKTQLLSNSNEYLKNCFKHKEESSKLIWDFIITNYV